MPDVTLRAILSGDSSSAVKAFADTSLAADTAGTKASASIDKSTGKISSLFQNLGSSVGNMLGLPIGNVFTKVESDSKSAEGSIGSFGSKLASVGKVVAAGGAAALVAAGVQSVKAANDFQDAADQYMVAAQNQGASAKTAKANLDTATASMQKLGFNSIDTANAMTTVARTTGNSATQQQILSTAADVARAKHISLGDAVNVVAQSYQGNQKALKQLNINVDLGSNKAKTLATDQQGLAAANQTLQNTQAKIASGSLKGVAASQALTTAQDAVSKKQQQLNKDQNAGAATLAAITSKVHGAATAYGNSLSGQISIAKAQVDNLSVSFGQFLIPKITAAIKVVTDIVQWFQKHKAAAMALAAVIGGVLAAALAAFAINSAVKFAKSIQSAVTDLGKFGSKIMDLLPSFTAAEAGEEDFAATSEATGAASSAAFGPIGLAIMAVVAIALLLVTHWKQVSKALDVVWNMIKNAALAVWDFIKQHLGIIIPIIVGIVTGGIGLLPALIATHWNTIRNDVVKLLSDIVNFFTALPGRIVNGLGDIVGTIWGALTNSLSWIDSNVIEPVLGFFTGFPGRAVAALGDIVGTVWAALKNSLSWYINNVEVPILNWFRQLPGKAFTALGDIVGTVFSALRNIASWLDSNVLTPVTSWFTSLPGKAASAMGDLVGTIFSGLENIGSWLDNNVWQPMESFFSGLPARVGKAVGNLLSDIPGVSQIGHLFGLASGGPLAAGQMAVVGEAGPEIFMPNTSGTIIPNNVAFGGGGPGGGSQTIIVNAETNADPNQIAAEVGWALRTAPLS